MRWKIVIGFFVAGILGFVLSQSMQAMLDGYKASTIKRSMGDALAISSALERYRQDHGRYPELSNESLSGALTPKYLRALPKDTYSGRPFVVLMSGAVPAVVAPGRGGFIVQNGKIAFFQPYRPADGQPTSQTTR